MQTIRAMQSAVIMQFGKLYGQKARTAAPGTVYPVNRLGRTRVPFQRTWINDSRCHTEITSTLTIIRAANSTTYTQLPSI